LIFFASLGVLAATVRSFASLIVPKDWRSGWTVFSSWTQTKSNPFSLFILARDDRDGPVEEEPDVVFLGLVGVVPTAEKSEASFVVSGFDCLAGFVQFRRIGWVVSVSVAVGHSHVARTQFGERQAGDVRQRLGNGDALAVFDFQAEHEFAERVQRPGVGEFNVLLWRDAPHVGRSVLAAGTAFALVQILVNPDRLERIAAGIDKRPNGIGVSGMSVQDAVHSH